MLDCWIAPDGKIHPVPECGHSQFARNLLGEDIWGAVQMLEDRGWIHVSGGHIWHNKDRRISNSQVDALFDLLDKVPEYARVHVQQQVYNLVENENAHVYS